MLWAALTTTYIVLENGPTSNGKYGPRLPWALAAHAVMTSALVALSSGRWQFVLFHISFGSAQLFSLYRVYLIYCRHRERANSPTPLLFKSGMGAYTFGIVCWQTDLLFCKFLSETWPVLSGLPNPQLHAWWHLLVSTGFYCLITVCCYDRLCTLHGDRATVGWAGGIIPYAHLSEGKGKKVS
jgi:dihydroceramidase